MHSHPVRIYLSTHGWPESVGGREKERSNTCWRADRINAKKGAVRAARRWRGKRRAMRRRERERERTSVHVSRGTLVKSGSQPLWRLRDCGSYAYTYLTTRPNPATCSTIENDRFPSADHRWAVVTETSNREWGTNAAPITGRTHILSRRKELTSNYDYRSFYKITMLIERIFELVLLIPLSPFPPSRFVDFITCNTRLRSFFLDRRSSIQMR